MCTKAASNGSFITKIERALANTARHIQKRARWPGKTARWPGKTAYMRAASSSLRLQHIEVVATEVGALHNKRAVHIYTEEYQPLVDHASFKSALGSIEGQCQLLLSLHFTQQDMHIKLARLNHPHVSIRNKRVPLWCDESIQAISALQQPSGLVIAAQ